MLHKRLYRLPKEQLHAAHWVQRSTHCRLVLGVVHREVEEVRLPAVEGVLGHLEAVAYIP